MKISSASKKVLASALSAAMVVAFAPTVAFAKSGDKVAVTIDTDGGIVEVGTASFPETVAGTTQITLPTVSKDGYGIDHFWYDSSQDGVDDASEDITTDTWTVPAEATGSITLKAVYKTPAITDAEFNQVAEGTDTQFKISLDNFTKTVAKKNSNYTLTVKKGSDTLKTWEYAAKAASGETDKYVTTTNGKDDKALKFQVNPVSTDTDAILLGNLASGEYTVELADDKGVVSTKKIQVVKVTFEQADGTKTSYFYNKATGFDATGTVAAGKTFLTSDGYAFDQAGSKQLSGDVTVTESSATQAVSLTSGQSKYIDGDAVKFTVSDTAAAKKGDSYKITLTDSKGGVAYEAAYEAAADGQWSQDIALTFDAKALTGMISKTAKTAGAYTVSVVKTPKSGEKETTVKSKVFTLTEFKYAAGEGTEFQSAYAKASAQDVFVDNADKTSGFATVTDVVKAKKGYENVKWQLNGKDINGVTNPVTVGGVNELTAVATVADTSDTVAAPTVASATRSLKSGSTTLYDYVVKLNSATANTQIYYTTDSSKKTAPDTAYNASTGIKLSDTDSSTKAAETIWVQAKKVSGATASTVKNDSDVIEVVFNAEAGSFASYTAGANAVNTFESYIGKSSTKWLAEAGVASAIASGKASVEGLGYYVDSTDENVAATVKAAYKALAESVDAAANAYLAKYDGEANVVEGTKVYTMTAKDSVAKAEKALSNVAKPAKSDYMTEISALITAVNGATYTEDKTVKAEDVTAAAAVTAQLKAAKTGAEAKAALEAYAALGDAAKKLVASADVAAVQEIATKAALVDSQDLAAARDLNGKKVTAKAKVGKKAQGKSFAYKLAASESGATASYAKVSGSKHIKISANGKVTFSKVKVAKKAKTYKAKVSVTYGTQTVTKTVQLVVKKK